MMKSSSKSSPQARAYVEWLLRHGRLLWALAIVLAIPATVRTAGLYAHLKSDLEELLPRQAPSVLAIDELRGRVPGLQYLGVVVDAEDAAGVDAANRFLDDLAARIRSYPPSLVRSVRLGNGVERAFLEKHAALYVDAEDLETLRSRFEAARDHAVAGATGSLLDDDEAPPLDVAAPPLDVSDLRKKYEERLPKGGHTEGDRYTSHALERSLLLVEAGGAFTTGQAQGQALLDRVRADVEDLHFPQAYAPGLRLGYSGDIAISVEELSALLADLSLSSVLVVLAVIAVIVAYYRWWRSVLIVMPPLLLAAVYSFALSSLPPFGVTELNANTAFLGSIIVGNGINFGIVLLARYAEERRQGALVPDALAIAVRGARIGTASAALAAGVAYASLVITQFRGFRQFGIVGGIGMIVSWVVAFVLMPPLVAWLDRNEKTAPRSRSRGTDGRIMTAVARLVTRYAKPIVVVGALLTLGAAWKAKDFNLGQLEYDFSKLRRADTWERGEGYWGTRMNELLGTYLTPLVFVTDDPAHARALATKLREAIRRPELAERIAEVRTLEDVVPENQERKITLASAIREDLTPKLRSELKPEEREYIERVFEDGALAPIGVADVPPTFTAALRERDGSIGKTVLVYPRPSTALWEGPKLVSFVEELRTLAASVPGWPPARVAGSLPLSADIISSIQHDSPIASGAAFLGVVAIVLLLFRWHSTSFHVLASLVMGVLWLLAGTMVFGVKINFANFIAFPITFGIGVDYAVNVVSRYREDGKRDIEAAVRSTGGAVALCSLTTIIGYSSLLVAQNRALYLFGVVAVLGEIACLLTGVVVMPAALVLFDRPSARPRPAPVLQTPPPEAAE